jgi:hypothetical protein
VLLHKYPYCVFSYNKPIGWQNKVISQQPYCSWMRNKETKIVRVYSSPYVLFFVVTSSRCYILEVTDWKSKRCERDNSVIIKDEKDFVVTLLNICLPICFILCDNVTTKNEFFSGRREEGGTLTVCSVTLLPAYSLVLFLSLLFRRGWNCRFLGLKNWADNFLFYFLIL